MEVSFPTSPPDDSLPYVVAWDAAGWCSLSLLGGRLDGAPMLDLLLPEASEPATAPVETTFGLHPGAGESQTTGHRSNHRRHPLGEGEEVLEFLLGAAPGGWRGSGGFDKEEVMEEPMDWAGPEDKQEQDPLTEQGRHEGTNLTQEGRDREGQVLEEEVSLSLHNPL